MKKTIHSNSVPTHSNSLHRGRFSERSIHKLKWQMHFEMGARAFYYATLNMINLSIYREMELHY